MKRGQAFVRAQDPSGKWHAADVLDLDEASFRAFVLDMLHRVGVLHILKDEVVEGDDITYRSTVPAEADE